MNPATPVIRKSAMYSPTSRLRFRRGVCPRPIYLDISECLPKIERGTRRRNYARLSVTSGWTMYVCPNLFEEYYSEGNVFNQKYRSCYRGFYRNRADVLRGSGRSGVQSA